MKAIEPLKKWLRKHMVTFSKRPRNGHSSLVEVDKTLLKITSNKQRINTAVDRMIADASLAKDIIKNNASAKNTNS